MKKKAKDITNYTSFSSTEKLSNFGKQEIQSKINYKNERRFHVENLKSNEKLTADVYGIASELPTHAKGDGMGFGFHRVCVIANGFSFLIYTVK